MEAIAEQTTPPGASLSGDKQQHAVSFHRQSITSYPPKTQRQQTQRRRRRNSELVRRGSVCMELIKDLDVEETYDIFKHLGTGRFSQVKLAEHRESRQKIALKIFPRATVKQADFNREYNYSYFLSAHPNIIDSYTGMFIDRQLDAFFFVQEFCPSGSLREAVLAANSSAHHGMNQSVLKVILTQVIAALEFMHNENLVHRNLKAENVLIFDPVNYQRVKVTDFALTRKVGTTVKYHEYTNFYHAPELCDTLVNETCTVEKSIDIWALGILIHYALRAKFPWQKATIMCKPYYEWEQYVKRKSLVLPAKFSRFTDKGVKLFKKTLHVKPKDRWPIKDVKKALKDSWIRPMKSVSDEDIAASLLPGVAGVAAPDVHHLARGSVISTGSSLGVRPPYPSAHLSRSTSNLAMRNSPSPSPQPSAMSTSMVVTPSSKRGLLQHWVSATFNTMAEISEQVVSAADK